MEKSKISELFQSAFYITDNETELLKSIRNGDNVALLHFVIANMYRIHNDIRDFEHKGVSTSELMKQATQCFLQGVDHYIEERNLEIEWTDRYFYDELKRSVGDLADIRFREWKFPKNISFLNRPNKMLIKRELQIMKLGRELIEMCEQRKDRKDTFTVDYMLEVEISYYIPLNQDPVHYYRNWIRVDDFKDENKNDNLLCDGKDHNYGGNWPSLDEPYCYLLHDLLDHSILGKRVVEIERIWFDVVLYNQDGITIRPDGSSSLLCWNENARQFE